MTGPAPAPHPDAAVIEPGVLTEVASGVRRLLAPNPGTMTGPGTNTYVLGDAHVAVVDPGPDDDDHFRTICDAVGDRLHWILATHTHIDHSPMAARLQAETGAAVLGFGPAPEHTGGLDGHDRTFAPDRRLGDGDQLDTGELRVAAVHTPGHCSNHLCFQLVDTGLLFSGDHVMSGSTVVIAPPDGDMTAYLAALERVRDLQPKRIAPGHGAMIEDPAAVLDHYVAHRRDREAQVLSAVRSAGPDGVTAEAIVAALYVGVADALHPVARYSVWAHLRKLAEEGRARAADADEIDAPWFAALA